MTPKIINTKPIVIVGLKANLSFTTNGQGTAKLAKQFMPNRNHIVNRVGSEKFSIQIYDQFDYSKMSPNTLFEKWIGVEVSNAKALPSDMEVLTIPTGQYAVFNYKGKPDGFFKAWQYIHTTWLPKSGYNLDDRPHFEKLPEDYHPSNPEVEEEIWVPII
ncbi:GyrI-like domain-containing protein [Olleya marilimosa]|uniref:GyrI-like domain-containing protein n=1 Tax=Olleya marilimosa TaxID=272164 RepID=UPI00168D13D0|nr:GyrI-like domain-containing protein [Olleya marilimosa]MBD3892070.1 GyrI-like domain-containing protein [Olleya marilimosa]